jgi:hypothetical protein
MAVHEIKVPFLAAVPVGNRIAIEIYDDDPQHPVIVDLVTGIRWGSSQTWGMEFGFRAPKLSRRSEVVVRGCWVGSGMGFNTNVQAHTKLLVEEPPKPEGPYR